MNMRLKKVLDDIQKTENKILELQEHVRQLRLQKKQMDDAEIGEHATFPEVGCSNGRFSTSFPATPVTSARGYVMAGNETGRPERSGLLRLDL